LLVPKFLSKALKELQQYQLLSFFESSALTLLRDVVFYLAEV